MQPEPQHAGRAWHQAAPEDGFCSHTGAKEVRAQPQGFQHWSAGMRQGRRSMQYLNPAFPAWCWAQAGAATPGPPLPSTALPCSQLSSPGEGSRSLRSTPSSSQGPSKPHWPPQALPSSCNRVKNYFADGKPAVRSPGRQRTQLSLHRRGPDPLQAGSVKRLSYYLRPWNRQSKLRHPTKHHSKGFARPLVFGQELMPVFVSDPS